jgi:hypothetical protein
MCADYYSGPVRHKVNPFAFKVNEDKMKNDRAPHYIPLAKRKYIKEYME